MKADPRPGKKSSRSGLLVASGNTSKCWTVKFTMSMIDHRRPGVDKICTKIQSWVPGLLVTYYVYQYVTASPNRWPELTANVFLFPFLTKQ